MQLFKTHSSAKHAWRRRRSQICRENLSPPPRLTLSEWADRYRMLSRENSSSPGRFRTSVVPYLKEVMDACTDRRVREVIVMKAAQVAFTDGVVNNLVAYHIDQDPAPILVVQITVDEAEKWSKEKLAPMLRDTPRLRGKVKDARSRDSDNTILAKAYPGGHLGIVGANAPSGLRARPRRVVIFDEIDGYPTSAGTEGDPIKLGEKRATTFWNRKILKGSTPTIKKLSKIEREFERSDQRRWFVACPHCGHEQVLEWSNVIWDKDGEGEEKTHRPETAAYKCEDCAAVFEERYKLTGRWVATNPGEGRPVGFHISGLFSPFVSWAEIVREFLDCKGSQELLQTWYNTVLGEPFEEKGESMKPGTLMARREPYAAEVPAGVGLLTAAVDVQGDRLEVKVKGYGADEESWLIHRETILGDPGQMKSEPGKPTVWERLDRIRERPWQHAGGAMVHVAATAIDYGGHHAEEVARYVKERAGANVFAIRGASTPNQPIWPAKPTRVGKHGVRVYVVGTDTAKDIILGYRIKRSTAGQGRMHYPEAPWCNQEYFEQLVSEKKVYRLEKGRRVRKYVPTRDRNEGLDLEVYCLAVLYGQGLSTVQELGRLAEELMAQGQSAAEPDPPAAEPERRRGGWMSGFR